MEEYPDLNVDIQGGIHYETNVVPWAAESPTSYDNITINQMIGASRSKGYPIKVLIFNCLLPLHIYLQHMFIEVNFVNFCAVYTKGLRCHI